MTPSVHPTPVIDPVAELLAHRDQFLASLRSRGLGAAAEDILHSAYVRLLERGLSIRDERKVVSWFRAVLRNAAIDHLRATTRRQGLHEIAHHEPSPGPKLDDDPPCTAKTLAMMETLEPGYRDALETVYVEGKSIGDVAAKSGISRNAATVRVHRARRVLGKLVVDSGACAA